MNHVVYEPKEIIVERDKIVEVPSVVEKIIEVPTYNEKIVEKVITIEKAVPV